MKPLPTKVKFAIGFLITLFIVFSSILPVFGFITFSVIGTMWSVKVLLNHFWED